VNQTVFGAEYAASYDELYGDKDYQAECELIDGVFKRYAHGSIASVLDLGCGTGRGQVIRVAGGGLDTRANACTVSYRVWRIEGGRLESEVREEHRVRYFFAPELELLLSCAGLELLRLGAFPNFDEAPSESTWNVAFVARAI
jgi:hypothetical protein